MRRVFYTLALATIAVACSDDGPTGPTSTVTLNQVNPVAPERVNDFETPAGCI